MLRHIFILFVTVAAFSLSAFDKIDWSKANKIREGVHHVRLNLEQPRLMKVNIIRVDLKIKGLYFTATPRDPDWGKPMPDYPAGIIRAARKRTRDFMKEARKNNVNMIIASNASAWSPFKKPWNHKYGDPSGLNILNGEVVSEHPTRSIFVVYNDGTPAILSSVPKEDYPKIRIAVSGFAITAKGGKLTMNDKPLHPRTAYGISADKRYLYLMTVDGRQSGISLGCTQRETGELLLAAGASDAINMDGGGSSTLIYWDPAKKEMVSLCSHKWKSERVVGSNIGICLR